MKLELKHLSGYLPYGLKVYRENKSIESDTFFIVGASKTCVFLQNNGLAVVDMERIKPILRPLSDLTKEIEVNGEKFVPNDLLNARFRQSSKDLVPYKSLRYNLELDIQTEVYSQTIDLFDGHLIVTQLLEWHFDIYGLIEQGLAIDINTLKL